MTVVNGESEERHADRPVIGDVMARTPLKGQEIGKTASCACCEITRRRLRDGSASSRWLSIYGSFARDEAGPGSDVDILVRFDAPPDWKRYFGAQAYLEDVLGVRAVLRARARIPRRARAGRLARTFGRTVRTAARPRAA